MNNIEQLFKLVFNNIVLFRNIYSHVRIYKNNKCVEFKSRKELLEYKEREYIGKIIYDGTEMLIEGDLPINGVLKRVEFLNNELSKIKGDAFPNGIENINYCWYDFYGSTATTQFSTLPSSVHTIYNAIVRPSNDIDKDSEFYKIPSNITSISFVKCSVKFGKYGFKIPNTIKILRFGFRWNNLGEALNSGDIPDSVTYLSITGYQTKNFQKGLLPNSIKELRITYSDSSNNLSEFIPSSVKNLYIYLKANITHVSNLHKCTSIKTLSFEINTDGDFIFEANSLPPSLTDLKITNIKTSIVFDFIPYSVKKLELGFLILTLIQINKIPNSVVNLTTNKIINQPDILPESLNELNLKSQRDGNHSIKDLIDMISILPQCLSSITLPKYCKDYDLTFPLSINKIKYSN